MMPESQYSVSVVVPTFRRPDLLIRCLAALMAQDFDATDYEVIIADDAACDKTRRAVDAWCRDKVPASKGSRQCPYPGPAVHYVPVTGTHGPAAARNAGWRVARGVIVAFTDDDCIPTPTWLRAGLAAFTNGDGVVGVSGRLVVPVQRMPTDYELNAAQLAKASFVTANCFYRRDCLAAIGGFDEHFTSAWREDSDVYFTLLERYAAGASLCDCVGDPFQAGRPQGSPPRVRSTPAPTITGDGRVPQAGRPQGSPPHVRSTPAPTITEARREGVSTASTTRGDGYRSLDKAFVYAPDAVVIHPLRPARWGVSLSQQRKSMFNALLYKKHPLLYRKEIQATPPWHYYGIAGALMVMIGALLGRKHRVAFGATCLWMFMTGRFCLQRLERTSRRRRHIAEMLVTSVLIPPLSIFWRIRGAIKFRVFFL